MNNETIKNQIKSNQFQRKRISEENIEQDKKKDITFMNNMKGDGIVQYYMRDFIVTMLQACVNNKTYVCVQSAIMVVYG